MEKKAEKLTEDELVLVRNILIHQVDIAKATQYVLDREVAYKVADRLEIIVNKLNQLIKGL